MTTNNNNSLVNRRKAMSIFAITIATTCMPFAAFSEDGKTKVDIDLKADTKDVHIRVGGNVTGVSGLPEPDNERTSGQYHAAWNAAPGAGKHKVSVSFTGAMGALKVKLTTTGNVNETINWAAADIIAYASVDSRIDWNSGICGFSLNNMFADFDAQFGTVTAIAVQDAALYDSDSWDQATGATYQFAGGTVAGGVSDQMIGSIAMNGASWVLVHAEVNGEMRSFAAAPVPEPGTLAALGALTIGLIRRRRKA